jgi:hypothetical protein
MANLGSEDTVIKHTGAIDEYTSFVGFNPTRQVELLVL